MEYKFTLKNPDDKVMWAENTGIGEMVFSFDGERVFNLFQDYPWKLSPEEIQIFDEENPFWAEYFSDRK